MILVFGASGVVGSALLGELAGSGRPLRAAIHTRPVEQPGVESVRVDLATGAGLDDACAGADAMFLLSADMPDQTAAELRAVEAARRAGVRRVVKLSVLGAESEAFAYARIHRPVERALAASGLDHILLRPAGFMQNFIHHHGHAIRGGALRLPCGDSREAHIDVRDIARVAARCLLEAGHEGRAYDLCGPAALTYHEVAAALSAAIGREVSYVPVSEDAFRAEMRAFGASDAATEALLELFRFHVAGRARLASDDVLAVTGRPPTDFAAFAREHAALWR